MVKVIWSILIVLSLLLFFVILIQVNQKDIKKTVSGVNSTLPEVSKLSRPPQKQASASDPVILAKSAILIDTDTSKTLYEKIPNEKVPIASTTKIMTGLVVLENYQDKLNETVKITSNMVNVEGSDAQLRVGENIKVSDLLQALLIVSGNDAAYSLAGYFGGKDQFVKLMNDKAKFIGLKNTQYQDPAGLDDNGYSTARDLSIIAAYAMRNSQFSNIVNTSETQVTSTDGRLIHDLKTSNRMLKPDEMYYFPNAIGVKTGFTPAAGHCLVGMAKKDNHTLTSVILFTNEDSLVASARESKKLLEWGFNNWQWQS